MVVRHTMKLQPKPFGQIANGSKTIELRLNDDKRQAMRVGDEVVFTKEPENVESLRAVIIERLEYPSFAHMAAELPPESMGYDTRLAAHTARPDYYSEADEQRFGALGLRLVLMTTPGVDSAPPQGGGMTAI